ncbi:MAG: FKBP-type peptidyl-prolyl cis-trans isomerase [Isosphaeraceae bacterium]
MRPRQCVIWGCLGLALSLVGCEPPEDIVATTPPGAVIPRTPPDANDPAQAQGESAVATTKATVGARTKAVPYTPAVPTEKGQTKTTKSGVKYETLTPGTGDELAPGMIGLFHYEGKLEDGTVFDSSRRRGPPQQFAIGTGQLIQGWEEAMPGMRVGEVRKLWIPAAMAYGTQQKGTIPPNSNLQFEVELVKILE